MKGIIEIEETLDDVRSRVHGALAGTIGEHADADTLINRLEEVLQMARIGLRLASTVEVKDNAGGGTKLHYSDLLQMGEDIREQDNRATSFPMFVVRQKRRTWGGVDYDNSDGHVWQDDQGNDVEDDELVAKLQHRDSEGGSAELDEYVRVYYRDTWETVHTFFTQRGADAYIVENAHNLTAPHVYVASGYRNKEWQRIRALLMALHGRDYGDEL